MCCRYYYEDFERELREFIRATKVVKLADFSGGQTADRDIYPSQASIAIHAIDGRFAPGGSDVDRRFAPSGGQEAGNRFAPGGGTEAEKRFAPGDSVGSTMSTLGVSEMYWGFANPVKKGLIINARAETAREKKMFADSIARRRCVIPASGFYEWDPYKARFRFTLPEQGLLFLAGFYRMEQGQPRYTILTTEANDSMIKVHDRMPVMIGRDEVGPWIEDDARLGEFLGRRQPELVCEQDTGQIRMDFGL